MSIRWPFVWKGGFIGTSFLLLVLGDAYARPSPVNFNAVPGQVTIPSDARADFIQNVRGFMGAVDMATADQIQLLSATVWSRANGQGFVVCGTANLIDVYTGTSTPTGRLLKRVYAISITTTGPFKGAQGTQIWNEEDYALFGCATPGGTPLL